MKYRSDRSATSASANPDPDARTAFSRDTGTIPMFSLVGSKEQIEQARADRELRKYQPDLIYNFRSHQGDFVASNTAYPGLARGVSGGAVTGGQPPDDRNPSRPLTSYPGSVETIDGNDLSSPTNSPYPSYSQKGLTRYQMNKFGGKESQNEYWELQFQASYGARSISAKEKHFFC